jgi:glycine/D-amino acid oxidase-like deaminating enzyme
MLRAYQIATKPLPASVLETILPGRQSMTDTRRLFSGIRVHASGRLHLSVDGPAFNVVGNAFKDAATERVRKLFPQIGDFEWDEIWRGWVGVTVNEYPRLLDMGEGRFGAYGYSGRGLALGTLLGRELARHISGNHPDDLVLPLTSPEPIHWRAAARPLVSSLMTLYRLLDARDERGVINVKA